MPSLTHRPVIALLTLLLLAAFASAAEPEQPADALDAQFQELKSYRNKPLRKEQFEKLLPILQANAAAWLEYQSEPYSGAETLVKSFKYDAQSLDDLTEVIKTLPRTDRQLYVLNQLLLPARGIKTPEEARKFVDVVEQAARRHGYRKLPTMSAAQAARLQMPAPAEIEKADSEAIMRKMAAVERLRLAKLNRERPLARNNEGLWQLEQMVYRLRILAAASEERDARKVIGDAERMAKDHNAMLKTLTGIAASYAQSGVLAKEVAEQWYDLMAKITGISDEKFWKKPWLENTIQIRLDGQSQYGIFRYAPKHFIADANSFAEKIGKPKLVEPEEKK